MPPLGARIKEATFRRTRSLASAWRIARASTWWAIVTVRLERVAPILVSAARTSAALRSRSGMAPISDSKGAATSR